MRPIITVQQCDKLTPNRDPQPLLTNEHLLRRQLQSTNRRVRKIPSSRQNPFAPRGRCFEGGQLRLAPLQIGIPCVTGAHVSADDVSLAVGRGRRRAHALLYRISPADSRRVPDAGHAGTERMKPRSQRRTQPRDSLSQSRASTSDTPTSSIKDFRLFRDPTSRREGTPLRNPACEHR